MNNNFMLYGVIDKSTGKLVSNITNPRRKYWDKKCNAEKAVKNYNPNRLTTSYKVHNSICNPKDLEVVEIKCIVDSTDVCEYKKNINFDGLHDTTCGAITSYNPEYTYCPYCGKKINKI